ncbi:hypothetical protein Q022_02241 [Pseudomonas aeruginosa BWHPSA009]|nr:hypothetical protein Q022_02241 [Pseudomonas aeruginosa BWHPSA009]
MLARHLTTVMKTAEKYLRQSSSSELQSFVLVSLGKRVCRWFFSHSFWHGERRLRRFENGLRQSMREISDDL